MNKMIMTFVLFKLLGLWITHCETPLLLHPLPPPSNLPDIWHFEWCSNAHLTVIPGDQMHLQPVPCDICKTEQ